MKVLVTGGLGFIGSNFILKALNENKELSIINVDAEFQGSDHKNLDSIKDNEKYSFDSRQKESQKILLKY